MKFKVNDSQTANNVMKSVLLNVPSMDIKFYVCAIPIHGYKIVN